MELIENNEMSLMEAAQKKVKAKKGFFWHLSVYIVIGTFFFLMNMATSPDKLWFFFPMMPWGIGLMFHYISVFGIPGLNILGDEWEKKELQKELVKLRAKQRMKEDMRFLEEQEEMLNINEADYLKMKEMREQNREF